MDQLHANLAKAIGRVLADKWMKVIAARRQQKERDAADGLRKTLGGPADTINLRRDSNKERRGRRGRKSKE